MKQERGVMQQASDRQRGGILAFIIVGLALAVLLGGAIYASKQQGRVASQASTVAVDTQKEGDNTDKTSDTSSQNNTNKDESSQGTSNTENSGSSDSSSQSTQQASPSTSQSGSSTQNSQDNVASTGPSSVASTGPSNIASTGPSDIIVPGLGVALLAGGIISYRRSASAVRSRALRS